MDSKKSKIKLFIIASNILLLILILLFIHICASRVDSNIKQTELDNHESIVPEIKKEIEEKKPVSRKQEKDEAPQEKKIVIDVDPRKDWQNSGIGVTPEMRITITHEKGKWAIGHEYPLIDAEGYPIQSIQRRYPLIVGGALVGRVGNSKVFKVGNYYEINASPVSGNLYFRINDADDYLFDNRGSITVKIIIQFLIPFPG